MELSSAYLYFYDRLERAKNMLNCFVDTALILLSSRKMESILHCPADDGGNWQMFMDLVDKYGIVPKDNYATSWTSENTRNLGLILNTKLREYCMVLRGLVRSKATNGVINARFETCMEEVYRIV
jgi:bleomycin hydrolase